MILAAKTAHFLTCILNIRFAIFAPTNAIPARTILIAHHAKAIIM
jgi:hypothetical protein